MEFLLFFKYLFIGTMVMRSVLCDQPLWNEEFIGDTLYTTSTETWQECGLLCTKNLQRSEYSLKSTECSAWTWNDPSSREYNYVCRFYHHNVSKEYNGNSISGATGCYSIYTC